MKRALFSIFMLFAALTASAQSHAGMWQLVGANEVPNEVAASKMPTNFSTYALSYHDLLAKLQSAPMEFTAPAQNAPLLVEFPNASNQIEVFKVCESPVMAPELAAKFPGIRTFSGVSTINPLRTIRFSVSVRGLRAYIFKPDAGVEYIDPMSITDHSMYVVYDRLYAYKPTELLGLERVNLDKSGTYDPGTPIYVPSAEDRGPLLSPVTLKKYRYACATTGEFTIDHGGTKESSLAAVVEYTNQITAIYERDIDVRLELVGNNDKVIFIDPATDPYTGTTVPEWMGQNQEVLDFRIGSNFYDIGQVVGRYLGGSAIGVSGGIVCINSKGRCCSAGILGGTNYGDFFVGVAGQETGHQLSGGHTWNSCNGGGGRNGGVAFEPGSGSTIMSYAGACGPDNVQGDADLYYHSGSVGEIVQFYTTGAGTGCGTTIPTTNNHPDVTLPYTNNFFIPIMTPFELNGAATDPDGDPLVHSWEQVDYGPEVPLGVAEGGAPLYIVYPASTATNRYFPKLSTVVNNGTSNLELMVDYSRDMTFRFIAKDNKTLGGGSTFKDVEFRTTSTAGPFLVMSPNTTAASWKVGEYVEVKWDVANTHADPVNCSLVNIRLSLDGGYTYPITLASNTGNDGSQFVLVPNNITTSARVRVDAVNNVFYDISNANFKIENPTVPTFSMSNEYDEAHICLPQVFSSQILTTGVLGFSEPVNFSIIGGLPPGATAAFTTTTVTPGQSTTLNIDMSNTTVEGTFPVTFRVNSPSIGNIDKIVTLTLTSSNFTAFALQSPADGSINLAQTPTFTWNSVADALTYDFQLASSPSFAPDKIIATKTNTPATSFSTPALLPKGSVYYWRVRPNNECGAGSWEDAYSFATFKDVCATGEANDLPKNISSNNTAIVNSTLFINTPGVISDVNINQLQMYHDYYKDLRIMVKSPSGTEVTLYDHNCGNISGQMNMKLDDSAPNPFPCPPANTGLPYRPVHPLSAFIGEPAFGSWTLTIFDTLVSSGGTLEAWQLEFCAETTLTPPVLINNNPLEITTSGQNYGIPNTMLRARRPQ